MSRDYLLFLDDIAQSSQKILRYIGGISYEQFLRDDKTYDAVIRNLEVIGEAVKNIPEEIRTRYPEIEWRKMAGLRDIVAHEYFGVSDEIVWDVIQNKIPVLLEQVNQILNKAVE
jgi:uncharacterized protein with HEPN domain